MILNLGNTREPCRKKVFLGDTLTNPLKMELGNC
jgi:hypothetical protein